MTKTTRKKPAKKTRQQNVDTSHFARFKRGLEKFNARWNGETVSSSKVFFDAAVTHVCAHAGKRVSDKLDHRGNTVLVLQLHHNGKRRRALAIWRNGKGRLALASTMTAGFKKLAKMAEPDGTLKSIGIAPKKQAKGEENALGELATSAWLANLPAPAEAHGWH